MLPYFWLGKEAEAGARIALLCFESNPGTRYPWYRLGGSMVETGLPWGLGTVLSSWMPMEAAFDLAPGFMPLRHTSGTVPSDD